MTLHVISQETGASLSFPSGVLVAQVGPVMHEHSNTT